MTHVSRNPIPRFVTLAAAAVLLGGALRAPAQPTQPAQPVIEITPTVGFRWGGEIRAEDTTSLDRDAKLADKYSLGITIDLPVSQHLAIELLADHQRTGVGNSTLFGPTDHRFDLDVDYYHVGALYQWPTAHVTPFAVGSLGVANLSPRDAAYSSTRRFSASVGAGVKVPISPNFAFRLEARGFWTDTGDSRVDNNNDEHNHHNNDCRDCSTGMVQGQARLGVTVSF